MLAFLPLAPAAGLDAQEQAQDLVGRVVRIQDATRVHPPGGAVGSAPGVGTLVGTRGDTVIVELRESNQRVRWVLGESSRVDRKGRVSAGSRGVIIGGLAGGLAGFLIADRTFNPRREKQCSDGGITWASTAWIPVPVCNRWEEVDANIVSRGARKALGAGLGGAAGILLGHLIGQRFEIDGWIPVRVPGQVGWEVRVAQVGEGWGPQVQLTF